MVFTRDSNDLWKVVQRKLWKKSILFQERFITLLYRVATINSRSITFISDKPNSKVLYSVDILKLNEGVGLLPIERERKNKTSVPLEKDKINKKKKKQVS